MKMEYLFAAVVAVVVLGNFAWRFMRNGSLTGALLDGKVRSDVGEIVLSSSASSSQTLKVHQMESATGEAFIGISLVSKAPLAARTVPFKLSKVQAQELVRLLQQAAG